jgi:hypothetical protein
VLVDPSEDCFEGRDLSRRVERGVGWWRKGWRPRIEKLGIRGGVDGMWLQWIALCVELKGLC